MLMRQPSTPKKKVVTFKENLVTSPRVPFKEIESQQSPPITPIASRTWSSTSATFHTKYTQHLVASRTRSKLLQSNKANVFSTSTLVNHINEAFSLNQKDSRANAVLCSETGNMTEHRHLIKHSNPTVHKKSTDSAADEFGRLFQGVGKGDQNGKRTKRTNIFYFIPRHKVPQHKTKDVTHARIVCKIRETKKNKHRTRITVGGNNVKCNGDVSTPTAHLKTAKSLFNNALSRPGEKFMTLDLANFYLMSLMKDYEHLRAKLKHMPQ